MYIGKYSLYFSRSSLNSERKINGSVVDFDLLTKSKITFGLLNVHGGMLGLETSDILSSRNPAASIADLARMPIGLIALGF